MNEELKDRVKSIASSDSERFMYEVSLISDNFFLDSLVEYLIEQNINTKSVVYVGYLASLRMVQPEVVKKFLKKLTETINTVQGLNLCKLFIESSITVLPFYPEFTNDVLQVEHLQKSDPLLYVMLKEMNGMSPDVLIRDIIKVSMVTPKVPQFQFQSPSRKFQFTTSRTSNTNLHPNALKALEQAMQQPVPTRLPLLFTIFSTYPPIDQEIFPWILPSLCEIVTSLISSQRDLQWESLEYVTPLKRLGEWMSSLTVRHGKTPSLTNFNIKRLLTDSIQTGTLALSLAFLVGFFKFMDNSLKPPHSYSIVLLEIVAAIDQLEDIRSDIKDLIIELEKLINLPIKSYFRRVIKVQLHNFDRQSFFSKQLEIQSSHSKQQRVNTTDYAFHFFNYECSPTQLNPLLNELIQTASKYNHHYFVPSKHVITRPISYTKDLVKDLISLSFSCNQFLAQGASALLENASIKVDFMNLFKSHFPNQYILRLALKKLRIPPRVMQTYFCDVLSNSTLRPFARRRIASLVQVLLEFYHPEHINSLMTYLRIQKQKKITTPISTNLFMVYRKYESNQSQTNLLDFMTTLNTSLGQIHDFIIALLSNQNHSQVEFVAESILQLRNDPGFSDTYASIVETIGDNASVFHAKQLFRFVKPFIKWRPSVRLLEKLSPSYIPRFCAQWIHLCLMGFSKLLSFSAAQSIPFCIKFVCTLGQLASIPEFYKPVVRAFYILSYKHQAFIATYHMLFLISIPVQCTQLRNIVMKACPDYHFPCTVQLGEQNKSLMIIIRPYITNNIRMTRASTTSNVKMIAKVIQDGDRFPIEHLVAYCVYNIAETDFPSNPDTFKMLPILDLMSTLCGLVHEYNLINLFTALIGHLRYPSQHTTFTRLLLYSLFPLIDIHAKELLLLELIRHLTSIEPAPLSVYELFNQIFNDFEGDIRGVFEQLDETAYFEQALKTIRFNYGIES